VPVDSVARTWWSTANQRSASFASLGTVSITSAYTRTRCNGSHSARPTISTTHGTQCTANAVGRNQGWAFNANKWSINAYGTDGADFEPYYNIMKLFHQAKGNNPTYGNKNPTISSNSWGYRSTSHRTTAYYFYRQGTGGGTGVSYTVSTLPGFMSYVGQYGDSRRMKGEHPSNSATTAGAEMINAGVIFVGAAGNANQKQVGSAHSDFNNYWSTAINGTLTGSTHLEFNITAYNTTNRRGYPQQLGKYTDETTGQIVYPVINIGALDDSYASNGKERKVNYSDMGNEIDCYAAADGTLTATNSTSGSARPDIYSIGNVGVTTVTTDNGVTGIAYTSLELTGSGISSVRLLKDKAFRITTTNSTTGTATTIGLNLLGAASLGVSTTPSVGDQDDGYWDLTLPFNIQYAGITTNKVYPGTNTYITFTGGSSIYNSITYSNPPLPKIMISCADNSCQRLYYGTEGSSPDRTYRIRYEGHNNYFGGVLGSPTIVYEVIFYENAPSQIDIHVGANGRVVTTTSSGSVLTSYDAKFSGTSSACPVACGLIACKLQHNRTWTWQNVRTWLQDTVGDANTSQFDTGVESTTATDANWANVNSLEGGRPIVIWDALTGNEPQEAAANTMTFSGQLSLQGLVLK